MKRYLLLLVYILCCYGAYAQYGLRVKATYKTNFMTTMAGVIKMPEGYSGEHILSNFPSFGGALAVGWSFERMYLDLNFTTNYDEFYNESDLFNQKYDYVVYASVGYKCFKKRMVALDVLVGCGFGLSRMRFDYPELEYMGKLRASTWVLPISTVIWFGDSAIEHGRFGISFEYMLPLLLLDSSITDGLELTTTKLSAFDFGPNTMSVGLKVQF